MKPSKCNDSSCIYCNPLDKKLAKALSKLDYKDTETLLVSLTEPIQHKISLYIDSKKIPILEEADDNISRIIGHLQVQLFEKRSKSVKQKRI